MAFGLGRGSRDPADAKLSKGTSHLRGRSAEPLQLLFQRQRLRRGRLEDAMAVTVDRDRKAVLAHSLVQDIEIGMRLFLETEDGGRDLVGSVIDCAVEHETGATALKPVVMAGIHLQEQPPLGHPVAASPVTAGASSAGTAQASSEENPAHGGTRQRNVFMCCQHFREVLVVKAGIGRRGQGHDSLLEGGGQPVMRWSTAVPMSQGSRAIPAVGSQHTSALPE